MSSPTEDNPDYCGPEGNKLRAEAHKYGDERHELMDAAHIAFEAGEKGKAKELSEKGKEAGHKMEETNKKAVEVILKYRNEGKGDYYLDLHGLFLEEAMSALKTKLEKLKAEAAGKDPSKGDIIFEVIPGAGHHSSQGKAIIKPKTMEELTSQNLPFIEKNAGTLLVTIKSTGPSIAAAGVSADNTSSDEAKRDDAAIDGDMISIDMGSDRVDPAKKKTEEDAAMSSGCHCIIM